MANISALISAQAGMMFGATPHAGADKPCVEFVTITQGGEAIRVKVDAVALLELMRVLQAFYQSVNVDAQTSQA